MEYIQEMSYLLDTHVWLWSLRTPEKLNRRVQQLMSKPQTELYLSPISIWEANHLNQRKRLNLTSDFNQWLTESLSNSPVQSVPINFDVAIQASRIHLPQPDFGDTFLAATAIVFDLTLITADEQLLNSKWLKTLPAN